MRCIAIMLITGHCLAINSHYGMHILFLSIIREKIRWKMLRVRTCMGWYKVGVGAILYLFFYMCNWRCASPIVHVENTYGETRYRPALNPCSRERRVLTTQETQYTVHSTHPVDSSCFFYRCEFVTHIHTHT